MELKKHRHIVSEKVPVVAMILWMGAGLFVMIVFGTLLSSLAARFIPLSQTMLIDIINSCLFILFLFFFKWWYRPEYKGIFAASIPLGLVLVYCAPRVLFSIGGAISSLIKSHGKYAVLMEFFTGSVFSGIGEEALFRGVTIPVGMRYMKSKHKVWISLIMTSAIFGISHIFNILAGADPVNALSQAFTTTCSGLYYGVLLLCTGSIVPGMACHALHNTITHIVRPELASGVDTVRKTLANIVINDAIALLLCLIALYILRRTGIHQIERIWQKKWGIENHPDDSDTLS